MENNLNEILLFRTNIGTAGDKYALQASFDLHPQIKQWSVDLEDEDHVLRIISPALTHETVIDMVTRHGYQCEELKDQHNY